MADVFISDLDLLTAALTDEIEVQRTAAGASGKLTLERVLALAPPPVWGDIGGTLSDQLDLQAALDSKAALGAENTAIWGQISGTLSAQADLAAELDLKFDKAGGTVAGPLTVTGAFTSPGIDDNAVSTALTIDNTGRVGIGTSNLTSGRALTVSGSGDVYLRAETTTAGQSALVEVRAADSGGNSYIYFNELGGPSFDGAIRYAHFDKSMRFSVNAAEVMRIDSVGKVIIADLAGTGTRNVQVQADGTLIAV